jgi:5'-AMP-activated protein kinase catalytic alpha subunit
LNTDPEKRYKIEDIRKHPWFNLVKCEENFRGTIVGIDQVPIDPEILKVLNDYSIDIEYAKKCLEANKHNSITATYYLLLKKHLKQGGDSIADPRSPKYNPNYFFRRQPGFTKLATAIPVEDNTQTPT